MKVEFEGITAEIDRNHFYNGFIDIDFGGEIVVQFEPQDGEWVAMQGVNWFGQNITSEIEGKILNFI